MNLVKCLKNGISVMLCMVFILYLMRLLPVYALPSVNKKAHKAFEKQMDAIKQEYSWDKLAYIYKDIDGDKVHELIVFPGFGFWTEGIYDYRNGSVKEVFSVGQGDITKYYKKSKVIVSDHGHMDVYFRDYYKMSGGDWIKKAYRIETTVDSNGNFLEKPYYEYYINEKKVSKIKFHEYIKKLKKGKAIGLGYDVKWKSY